MITDIGKTIRREIDDLISKLIETYPEEFKQVDVGYLEVQTPFLTNPDARNEEWKTKTGIVFYADLLSYSDRYIKRGNPEIHEASHPSYRSVSVTVPWICVRFELEGNPGIERDLCKWMVENFKGINYRPFMDEDATWNYFAKEERKGYTKYKMYVNPDYPEGYWENHTLH